MQALKTAGHREFDAWQRGALEGQEGAMKRTAITRALAGLLCPMLLLASCAAGQKHVEGVAEAQITNNGSPPSAPATEAPAEEWKYDETYYEEQMAEAEPGASPQEAEQEEPDQKTTAGKVAIGALKVVGTIVLVTLWVAALGAMAFAQGVMAGR